MQSTECSIGGHSPQLALVTWQLGQKPSPEGDGCVASFALLQRVRFEAAGLVAVPGSRIDASPLRKRKFF
jgi:hypothetical protein